MKLTEKGKQAFELACKYYKNEPFSAAKVSNVSLNSVSTAKQTLIAAG